MVKTRIEIFPDIEDTSISLRHCRKYDPQMYVHKKMKTNLERHPKRY